LLPAGEDKQFDLAVDLDECVQSWNGIASSSRIFGSSATFWSLLQERKPPSTDHGDAVGCAAPGRPAPAGLRKRTGLREERDAPPGTSGCGSWRLRSATGRRRSDSTFGPAPSNTR